jgi:hypothetical protein
MVDFCLILQEVFYLQSEYQSMESCSTGNAQEICWFCRKGRHEDCMKEIPIDGRSDGPEDCTFDTKLVPCKCNH